ncbi:TPA: hypothetical protein N0F65_010815 [Lagenidium giganteum]|uniref:Uncharacterized protein n=1 Tax=Lagenidium giganteum TaxID=4803 RepID=A0AAV2Z2M2_9STRA|nr:TPA: hypothetical protein N0F65_010815 [Lagenidium giganteum]
MNVVLEDHHTIVSLTLWSGRYTALVLLGLSVAIAYGAFSLEGVVLESNILDEVGSSKNADDRVESFNAVTGALTFTFTKIFEFYAETFVFPSMLTYLLNCSLFPGDQPQRVRSHVKEGVLFWSFKALLILFNIGTASLYVGQRRGQVEHNVVAQDLYLSNSSLATPIRPSNTSANSMVDLQNTILRAAVREYTAPFELLDRCQGNGEDTMYRSEWNDVDSTSVTYGFPLNEWNSWLLPRGVKAATNITLRVGDFHSKKGKFNKAADELSLNIKLAYDLFLQGKLQFERAVSDMDLSLAYPCGEVDGRWGTTGGSIAVLRPNATTTPAPVRSAAASNTSERKLQMRRTQSSTAGAEADTLAPETSTSSSSSTSGDVTFLYGDDKYNEELFPDGKRKCRGARTSLHLLENVTSPSMQTLEHLVETITTGINFTTPTNVDDITIGFHRFEVSQHIGIATMTIDFPLIGDYRPYGDGLSTRDFFPYECGAESCVFTSTNVKSFFRRELLLTRFMTDCNVKDLKYSPDYSNYLPTGCKPQDNATFLYGLGTYVRGDSLEIGSANLASLKNPQTYVSLSFGRLVWTPTDLDKTFDVQCGGSGCRGLDVPLQDGATRKVLLVGDKSLPTEHATSNATTPLRLLALNTAQVPLKSNQSVIAMQQWNYINTANIPAVDLVSRRDEATWTTDTCNPLVDSYVAHLEANRFIMEKPLQPMLTASLFYLLQNGIVLDIDTTSPASQKGGKPRLQIAGAQEEKVISFSIPSLSAGVTLSGCGLMCLLAAAVIAFPLARVKLAPHTTPAAEYVRILTDDLYPDTVHHKRLRFDNGDALPMNDYVVDGIILRAERDHSKRIFL